MRNPCDVPLFSVIIPVFNGEKYIGEALRSVFADSFHSFEIIVVDDGSTDNTANIVSSFPDVQYHFQSNQGVAVARNTGIGLARGKYIAFLDSDDVWVPGRFSCSLDVLESKPEVQYVLGQLIMFLEEGCSKPKHIRDEWLEKPVDAASTSVLMARRAVFDHVGFFNPLYRTGQDTEWLLRANERGVGSEKMPCLFIRRRLHANNLTNAGPSQTKANLLRMIRESVTRKKQENE